MAARQGHFRLESGHHSNLRLDLDSLFVQPTRVHPLMNGLAEALRGHEFAGVCGPLVGGAFLAQMLACALAVEFCFTERIMPAERHGLYRAEYRLPRGLHDRVRSTRFAKQFTEVNSYAYLQLGAKGLLSYSQVPKLLPQAIQTVAQFGFWVERSLLSRCVDSMLPSGRGRQLSSGVARLSPRQKEVLDGLLQNLSNKEISNKLHRSERTAKFHVSNLLVKFGVRRREDLVALYYQARFTGHTSPELR